MKKNLLFLFLVILVVTTEKLKAQSSTTTLDVVSWNLEFFGAPYNSGPPDKDLQEANAKKIMRYFDADIYGLVEIVDTVHLRKLRDSLGTNFEYIIAPYSTDGPIGTNGWRQSQKLAFLYKKDLFSNINTRGMMLNSPTAVSNWANGRLPFLMKADVTINGITKTVHFILIHGKAGSTASDYNRRLAGAQELKDTLDASFSTANVMIIGDYNDALTQTISIGSGPQSSYQPIVADSTDADHYKSITLPLGQAGQTSMINFPNVVDNHAISNEVVAYYVLNSAQIRTDVTTVVPNYVTAHNTSDHYPVFSKYSLAGIITGLPVINPTEFGIRVSPNPFNQTVTITATKSLNNVQIRLINMQGQVISSQLYGMMPAGSSFQPSFPDISKGMYFLQVETKQYRTVIKLIHL
ncbi:MAG TPA: T9SS type A sorting domain-containing protein [Chitinophagaceae bacterium]|nr:T9SS type A sorting domain-containing protein [Chitinophagaceae bacterium]HQX71791.1 T9SS type A sorting domain-containing protein [Chitinophagaceae bacterium]HQZ74315.1 T9SS type A sorting domain-containing protein [Chitinophagaceae bacterium]